MRAANIIIFIIAFGGAFWTLRLFLRERTGIRSTFFWVMIWIAIGIFGLFPNLIDFLMGATMMRDRMIFVFVVSILAVYAMLFRQNTENFELKRKLNRIAQELACLRYEVEYGTKTETKKVTPPDGNLNNDPQ